MATAQKIMIIRHAEKPSGTVQGVDINGKDGAEFLVVQGWQRAGALVRFFAPLSAQFQHPGIEQPQFLFASGPVSKKDKKAGAGGSKSDRPEQTITPLSQFLGSAVPFNLDFAQGEEQQVAAAAMACNGVALIAWQHEDIPAIADAILGKTGVVAPQWPGTRFDLVWVFDVQPSGQYSFTQVPQMLLAGDLPSIIPTKIDSGNHK
jgi:hypothetical protein